MQSTHLQNGAGTRQRSHIQCLPCPLSQEHDEFRAEDRGLYRGPAEHSGWMADAAHQQIPSGYDLSEP